MPNDTTPASVSEFTSWISNDWKTQTASEAAKTTYGAGTGLLYDGFEKAVTRSTGWVPPFGTADDAAKAAKLGGNVMKATGIVLGVTLDLGEGASLASQGKTNDAWCKVASAVGGVAGGLGGAAAGPVGAAFGGYIGSKGAEYLCRKAFDLPVDTGPAGTTTPRTLPTSEPLPTAGTPADMAKNLIKFRSSVDYSGDDGAYTVSKGQTLSGIAKANGITLKELVDSNPQITDPNSIRTGQVIRLPENASGYKTVSGQTAGTTSSGLPDDVAQESALAHLITGKEGDVNLVLENSGRIVVQDKATGQTSIVAQDGSVSTTTAQAYWSAQQASYDQQVAGGMDYGDDLLLYQDYATGQGGVFSDAGGGVLFDSAHTVAFTNAGMTWLYDEATETSRGWRVNQATGQLLASQAGQFDDEGRLTDSTIYSDTNADGKTDQTSTIKYNYSDNSANYSSSTKTYDAQGRLLRTTETQTYDDGSQFNYKTEGGKNYIQAIDEDGKASGWKEYKTPAQEQATNAMYSDMAGFVNALRGKDKVNQLLYAAKIGLNYQIANGAQNATILGLNQNHLAGLSAVVGVMAGLRALRSDDTKTQISGAVGLVSSANTLYSLANTGGESISAGFLSPAQAGALQLVGAAISIANLKHLDEMIDNGQYGSAMATLYGAYVGGVAIYTAATAGISAMMTGAAAAGPAGLILAIGVIALDSMFAEDPPPPPPFGDATFRRDAKGQLVWDYGSQSNDLGRGVLAPHLQAMADKLKTYVQESNKDVIDVDRQYVLLASRLPKVYIQSWPSYTDNGKTNFYFALEQKHPQTGELVYSNVARDDIDSDYAAYTVLPEALVQRWQAVHMASKFGADEAKWLTEGQWAQANCALESQRSQLAQELQAAQTALTEAKQSHLKLFGEQVVAGGTDASTGTTSRVALAEQKLNNALAALQIFTAEHPQTGELAARMVDSALVADMQRLKTSDPEGYLKAYNTARENARQQWMKVIALDWDGDGKITHLAAPASTGTDLKSLQSDGATRFDVDGDGYREVTEWIGPGEAMLGIDRDGDGVIGNASELFNAAATAFDQRGWGSLKYYDSNNDNQIDRSDAVFKLLRLHAANDIHFWRAA